MDDTHIDEAAMRGELTLDMVRQQLQAGAAAAAEHGVEADPDAYWAGADLGQLNHALARWWPRDAPVQFAPPRVGYMLRTFWNPSNAGQTFWADFSARANRCLAWVESEGRDPANPNESKEERKRRLARERMARYRERKEAEAAHSAGGTEADERDALVLGIQAELAGLKLGMSRAVEPLRRETARLHQLVLDSAAHRKEVEADWRRQIADAEDRLALAKLGAARFPGSAS